MHRGLVLVLPLIALLVALPCRGGEEDTHPGRFLAANCTGCHGTNGRSVGAIPVIAGLDRAAMVGALRAFRAGEREATVMHQHAKGYTESQIDLLADYFSAQKPL